MADYFRGYRSHVNLWEDYSSTLPKDSWKIIFDEGTATQWTYSFTNGSTTTATFTHSSDDDKELEASPELMEYLEQFKS